MQADYRVWGQVQDGKISRSGMKKENVLKDALSREHIPFAMVWHQQNP